MQISMRNLFHNYFFKSILTSYTEVVPNRKVRDFFLSLKTHFYPLLSLYFIHPDQHEGYHRIRKILDEIEGN